MKNRTEHHQYEPLERLLRDLAAHGVAVEDRLTVDERLAAILGDDLLAAVRAELYRLEREDSLLRDCTRRAA
jgi:hypothetical protein